MSICQHCGNHFIGSALCSTCRPAAPAANEYAAPLRLPLVWQRKFALIEQAGGVDLPKLAQLPLATRIRLHCNPFAMLFGVLYYLCKGMWKRGLALTLLLMAMTIFLYWVAEQWLVPEETVHRAASAITAVVYAWRANLDYYKHTVLGDDSWW